jgi:hypothetical protein
MQSSSEIYNNILIDFYNDIKKNFNIIKYENTNNVAIIIEPRINLPYVQAVIYNFIYFMNPNGWNFIIYCNLKELDNETKKLFFNCELKQLDEELIYRDYNTQTYNISIDNYNKILLDINFWKSISERYENISIFQSDCIMYTMFNDYWLNYDYAGANYDYSIIVDNNIKKTFYINNKSIFSGGINGGFSIRKRKTMIECIENISWGYIQNYRQELFNILKISEFFVDETTNNKILSPINIFIKNEDIFFTHACEILRKKMPDSIHRHLLAIETSYCNNTCVYHGWNKNYHSYEKAIHLLSSSPLFSKYVDKYIIKPT